MVLLVPSFVADHFLLTGVGSILAVPLVILHGSGVLVTVGVLHQPVDKLAPLELSIELGPVC